MPKSSKPVVRLDSVDGSPNVKKKSASTPDPIVKLAIRLNEGVNDALRALIRYRGDLSVMAIEALETVELATVSLVSVEDKVVRDTTISLPRALHKKLKKIAENRSSSMNILVNTGLAYWLAGKGAISLR